MAVRGCATTEVEVKDVVQSRQRRQRCKWSQGPRAFGEPAQAWRRSGLIRLNDPLQPVTANTPYGSHAGLVVSLQACSLHCMQKGLQRKPSQNISFVVFIRGEHNSATMAHKKPGQQVNNLCAPLIHQADQRRKWFRSVRDTMIS